MTDVIKNYLKQFLISTTLKLSGGWAWVANLFFNYVWKYLVKLGIKFNNMLKNKKQASEKLDDHMQVINDPNSSAEDVRNSDDTFLK